jgi:hypothetical protein
MRLPVYLYHVIININFLCVRDELHKLESFEKARNHNKPRKNFKANRYFLIINVYNNNLRVMLKCKHRM